MSSKYMVDLAKFTIEEIKKTILKYRTIGSADLNIPNENNEFEHNEEYGEEPSENMEAEMKHKGMPMSLNKMNSMRNQPMKNTYGSMSGMQGEPIRIGHPPEDEMETTLHRDSNFQAPPSKLREEESIFYPARRNSVESNMTNDSEDTMMTADEGDDNDWSSKRYISYHRPPTGTAESIDPSLSNLYFVEDLSRAALESRITPDEQELIIDNAVTVDEDFARLYAAHQTYNETNNRYANSLLGYAEQDATIRLNVNDQIAQMNEDHNLTAGLYGHLLNQAGDTAVAILEEQQDDNAMGEIVSEEKDGYSFDEDPFSSRWENEYRPLTPDGQQDEAFDFASPNEQSILRNLDAEAEDKRIVDKYEQEGSQVGQTAKIGDENRGAEQVHPDSNVNNTLVNMLPSDPNATFPGNSINIQAAPAFSDNLPLVGSNQSSMVGVTTSEYHAPMQPSTSKDKTSMWANVNNENYKSVKADMDADWDLEMKAKYGPSGRPTGDDAEYVWRIEVDNYQAKMEDLFNRIGQKSLDAKSAIKEMNEYNKSHVGTLPAKIAPVVPHQGSMLLNTQQQEPQFDSNTMIASALNDLQEAQGDTDKVIETLHRTVPAVAKKQLRNDFIQRVQNNIRYPDIMHVKNEMFSNTNANSITGQHYWLPEHHLSSGNHKHYQTEGKEFLKKWKTENNWKKIHSSMHPHLFKKEHYEKMHKIYKGLGISSTPKGNRQEHFKHMIHRIKHLHAGMRKHENDMRVLDGVFHIKKNEPVTGEYARIMAVNDLPVLNSDYNYVKMSNTRPTLGLTDIDFYITAPIVTDPQTGQSGCALKKWVWDNDTMINSMLPFMEFPSNKNFSYDLIDGTSEDMEKRIMKDTHNILNFKAMNMGGKALTMAEANKTKQLLQKTTAAPDKRILFDHMYNILGQHSYGVHKKFRFDPDNINPNFNMKHYHEENHNMHQHSGYNGDLFLVPRGYLIQQRPRYDSGGGDRPSTLHRLMELTTDPFDLLLGPDYNHNQHIYNGRGLEGKGESDDELGPENVSSESEYESADEHSKIVPFRAEHSNVEMIPQYNSHQKAEIAKKALEVFKGCSFRNPNMNLNYYVSRRGSVNLSTNDAALEEAVAKARAERDQNIDRAGRVTSTMKDFAHIVEDLVRKQVPLDQKTKFDRFWNLATSKAVWVPLIIYGGSTALLHYIDTLDSQKLESLATISSASAKIMEATYAKQNMWAQVQAHGANVAIDVAANYMQPGGSRSGPDISTQRKIYDIGAIENVQGLLRHTNYLFWNVADALLSGIFWTKNTLGGLLGFTQSHPSSHPMIGHGLNMNQTIHGCGVKDYSYMDHTNKPYDHKMKNIACQHCAGKGNLHVLRKKFKYGGIICGECAMGKGYIKKNREPIEEYQMEKLSDKHPNPFIRKMHAAGMAERAKSEMANLNVDNSWTKFLKSAPKSLPSNFGKYAENEYVANGKWSKHMMDVLVWLLGYITLNSDDQPKIHHMVEHNLNALTSKYLDYCESKNIGNKDKYHNLPLKFFSSFKTLKGFLELYPHTLEHLEFQK